MRPFQLTRVPHSTGLRAPAPPVAGPAARKDPSSILQLVGEPVEAGEVDAGSQLGLARDELIGLSWHGGWRTRRPTQSIVDHLRHRQSLATYGLADQARQSGSRVTVVRTAPSG